MAQARYRDAGQMRAKESLARAYQLWALLQEMEECTVVVAPEAMAELLAGRSGGDVDFDRVRAWLDALRVAQARRLASLVPAFLPQPLRLSGGGDALPQHLRPGTGALHTRATRVGGER